MSRSRTSCIALISAWDRLRSIEERRACYERLLDYALSIPMIVDSTEFDLDRHRRRVGGVPGGRSRREDHRESEGMSQSESSPSQLRSTARDDVRQKLGEYLAEVIPGCSDITVKLSDEALKAGFSAETILFEASYRLNGERVERPLVLRRQNSTE